MRNSGRSSRLTPEGLTAWRHRTSGSTARLDEMTNSPSPYLRRGWLASRALSAPHVAPGSEIRMIDHVLNRLKRFRLRIGARGLEQHPTTREIDLYGVGRAPPLTSDPPPNGRSAARNRAAGPRGKLSAPMPSRYHGPIGRGGSGSTAAPCQAAFPGVRAWAGLLSFGLESTKDRQPSD